MQGRLDMNETPETPAEQRYRIRNRRVQNLAGASIGHVLTITADVEFDRSCDHCGQVYSFTEEIVGQTSAAKTSQLRPAAAQRDFDQAVQRWLDDPEAHENHHALCPHCHCLSRAAIRRHFPQGLRPGFDRLLQTAERAVRREFLKLRLIVYGLLAVCWLVLPPFLYWLCFLNAQMRKELPQDLLSFLFWFGGVAMPLGILLLYLLVGRKRLGRELRDVGRFVEAARQVLSQLDDRELYRALIDVYRQAGSSFDPRDFQPLYVPERSRWFASWRKALQSLKSDCKAAQKPKPRRKRRPDGT